MREYRAEYDGQTTCHTTAREAQAAAREALLLAAENRDDSPPVALADATGGDHWVYQRLSPRCVRRHRHAGNLL